MQKCHIRGKIKTRNKRRPGAGATITSTIITGTMTSLILLLAAFIGPSNASATASTLSLSVSDGVALDIATVGVYGTFVSSSTSDTIISITTDHASGYTLGIAASAANDNDLKYTEGGTVISTIPPITTPVTVANYANDAYAASNNLNNTWGFRPSKYNSVDNADSYYPGPTGTTATILDVTTAANPAAANDYNIAIGSRINSSQTVGSYSNTFVITAVANATPYTIAYDKNTTDTVTGMPAAANASTYTETVPISDIEPTRDGYVFNGWCTEQTADNGSCSDVSGTEYQPAAVWALDQTSTTNSLTLYAIWEKAGIGACAKGGVPRNICYDGNGADAGEMPNQPASANSTEMLRAYNYKRDGYAFLGWSTVKNPTIGTDVIYGPMEVIATPSTVTTTGLTLYAVWLPKDTTETMQSFTAADCSSRLTQIIYNSDDATFTVSPDSFIALEDTRDNNVYAVARLSDGNCWMLENLRLDENATNITTQSQGVGGDFVGLAASEDANFASSTIANDLYNTGNAYTMPRYNRNNTNFGGTNSVGTSLDVNHNVNDNHSQWYGYGNYYTWAAAKANTTAMAGIIDSNNTATSICPTNWRLPIGNSTAAYSFSALSTSMGGASTTMNPSSTPTGAVMAARLRHFPNNFVYSGSWGGSLANERSIYGYYWSSTASSSNYAYRLSFGASYVYPGTVSYYKYYGFPIRCVAGA